MVESGQFFARFMSVAGGLYFRGSSLSISLATATSIIASTGIFACERYSSRYIPPQTSLKPPLSPAMPLSHLELCVSRASDILMIFIGLSSSHIHFSA